LTDFRFQFPRTGSANSPILAEGITMSWTALPRALFIVVMFTLPVCGQVNVLTYHNDNSRTGQNLLEVTLTPTNVATNFGKLYTIPVDDWVVAQPLYVANVNFGNGVTHNVIYVATLNNTVYAFDADTPTTTYWSQNYGAPTLWTGLCQDTKFQTAAHGGAGIVSTPVIDSILGNIYFVAKSGDGNTNPYALTFYAVNIVTGATVASTTVNPGTTDWNPRYQMSRPGLAEDPTSSYIYVGLGATGCQNDKYEHGFVMAYSTTTGQTAATFATTIGKSNNGGIWQGGGGLAVDASGDIYFETADANYSPANSSYGDSILKINTGANTLSLLDWFTPYNQRYLQQYDLDLSSVGPLLLPDQSVGTPHLLVGSGKTEEIYLLNRDNMGKYVANGNNSQIAQYLPTMTSQTGCMSKTIGSSTGSTCRNATPIYFNNGVNSYVYFVDDGNSSPASLSFPCDLLQYTLSTSTGTALLSSAPTAQATFGTNCLVGSPSISANGTTNGIVWFVVLKGTATALHAVDPVTLTTIYNSQQHSKDKLGLAPRFVTSTVANGKVYVGGRSSTGGELVVYGLLSAKAAAPPVRKFR
jgi:hypothetical protein